MKTIKMIGNGGKDDDDLATTPGRTTSGTLGPDH